MTSIADFVSILKEKHLWVSNQHIAVDMTISGKPVTDSRQIEPNDVFICIKGLTTDGHQFIEKARELGASLIVCEDAYYDELPCVRVTDSRKAAAILAKLYYLNPTGKFVLIGVTGTNGKTTTSLLIWQALTQLGFKTGWVGTLGYRIDDEIYKTNNTTPDIIELNSIFNIMVSNHCQYVVMEVSSHALALDRVYDLEFDLAVFTNLSRDHLDFHKDMESYFESKYILFKETLLNNGICIINSDDEYGKRIVDVTEETNLKNVKTVSEIDGDITILSQTSEITESEVSVRFDDSLALSVKTKLVGHFNILNLVMALASLKVLLPKVSDASLINVAMNLAPVKGRLEKVDNDSGRAIFVDYAHTPDALKNVLSTLKQLPHNRLMVVFGAGGDRDKGKRSEMLKEVLSYSDATIITDDNPRFENPCDIIKEIVDGNNKWAPWWIIRDREKAIQTIIRLSQDDDIILIAGKGHETYQEYEGVRYPFDDVSIAEMHCTDCRTACDDKLCLPIDPLMLGILYSTPFHYIEPDRCNSKSLFNFVSTDTRKLNSGSVYFALKGEHFDGNAFVGDVLMDKSNCAVISDTSKKQDNAICVSDSQAALGLLAKKYLLMFQARRIALTGSTGKTTTKEYLANIFAETGKLLKTKANENNVIGLSKTIFRITPEDKHAIFELGTNHFGEIASLAEICEPETAIITNIGPSHLEFLIDENGVYKEKTDLFKRTLKTMIYPGDDDRFIEFKSTGIGVGQNKHCNYRITDIVVTEKSLQFCLNSNKIVVPQTVSYYAQNIAMATACAIESGLTISQVQSGLLKPLDLKLRMEIVQSGKGSLLIDCYNANPVSMKAAIEFWLSYRPGQPHIAILGDMLELGDNSIEFHKHIGLILRKANYHRLYAIGKLASNYVQDGSGILSSSEVNNELFKSVEGLITSHFTESIPIDSIILIKASHGMQLEKVIPMLKEVCTNADESLSKQQ